MPPKKGSSVKEKVTGFAPRLSSLRSKNKKASPQPDSTSSPSISTNPSTSGTPTDMASRFGTGTADDPMDVDEDEDLARAIAASLADHRPATAGPSGKQGKVNAPIQAKAPAPAKPKPVIDPNLPPKGRKRFLADQAAMKEACKQGYEVGGLKARYFRAGDDEGNVEFKVECAGKTVLSVSLLVSDTSEYPKEHSFFAFSSDGSLPESVTDVLGEVAEDVSRTMEATVTRLLQRLAKPLGATAANTGGAMSGSEDEVDGDDDGDDADYEMYDEDGFGMGSQSAGVGVITPEMGHALQADFNQIVAAGYRPGLTNSGTDLILSVSLPVLSLPIPPTALNAWDQRLLSSTQHLTLLISGFRNTYPPLLPSGKPALGLVRGGGGGLSGGLQFRVGLCPKYKPGKEPILEVIRTFALKTDEAELAAALAPPPLVVDPYAAYDSDQEPDADPDPPIEEDEEEELAPDRFDRFSLSSSLETLLDQNLVRLVQLRMRFEIGWAGAEFLLSEVERRQVDAEMLYDGLQKQIRAEDKEEVRLRKTYHLPVDPLVNMERTELNLPLIAFCYLVRRLTLCTRYCLVCHDKIRSEFEALKPYVCDSKLCTYRYYAHNHGPSIEYEIRSNPNTVDLLVSLAHVAAADGVLNEPLPVGMGLRVPPPKTSYSAAAPQWRGGTQPEPEDPPRELVPSPEDGLVEFDALAKVQMRASIVQMINLLPPIMKMKKFLDRKVPAGQAHPKLREMDPTIPSAAWLILRWCVASCTAYLHELTDSDELVRNIDGSYRQFRFSVGAPDAEAKFQAALGQAHQEDPNVKKYPSLYAFHGSALRNWHSIIRHGLWAKYVANGRAYGDGVYFAKDGGVSMGHYAQPSGGMRWKNSEIMPSSCVALAAIVNLPQKFQSTNPFFVVQQTEWIMCRYLLVKTMSPTPTPDTPDDSLAAVPYVPLDPKHPLTLVNKAISIPEQSYKLNLLLKARRAEMQMQNGADDYDLEDVKVFEGRIAAALPAKGKGKEVIDVSDDEDRMMDDEDDYRVRTPPPPPPPPAGRPADDWQHDREWVEQCVQHLLPPPRDHSGSASMALQRELKAMLREQERALAGENGNGGAGGGLKELGWYMPEEFMGDNLYQWVVELHSFEEGLPLEKDMKTLNIPSLVFEIRFPGTYPLSPPFFRIVKPRFLPFIQGGGGHVTGGGSMCMDLLTADGWLPSYSISAILLQIKLAISNLDPRPARLAPGGQHDMPYRPDEALTGYKRAAATHGWTVPEGLDKLVQR